mgnify:CR=1 FL=1
MKITLKDGSVKEYEHSMSVIDIAKDLSEGLARVATSGRVNGELVDLRTVVDSDSEVEILTFDNEEGKGAFFHTTSHIMAQAIKRLYPETNLQLDLPSKMDFIMIWIVRRHLWQKILKN